MNITLGWIVQEKNQPRLSALEWLENGVADGLGLQWCRPPILTRQSKMI